MDYIDTIVDLTRIGFRCRGCVVTDTDRAVLSLLVTATSPQCTLAAVVMVPP